MVRSFIVLLLLAVFFLTGMLLGIDQGNTADKGEVETVIGSEEISREKPINGEKEVVEQEGNTDTVEMKETVHFTQKTASVLESGVKGFYEMIVQILYQIAQLFF